MASEALWHLIAEDFSRVTRAWMEEGAIIEKLMRLSAERDVLVTTGTEEALGQIDRMELEALDAVNRAEREELLKRVRQSSTWGRLFEHWRDNTRIRESGGAPIRLAFTSERFRRHEAGDLLDFVAMRSIVRAAAAHQRERLEEGNLEIAVLPEKEKAAKLAKLEKAVALAEARLADAGLLARCRWGRWAAAKLRERELEN